MVVRTFRRKRSVSFLLTGQIPVATWTSTMTTVKCDKRSRLCICQICNCGFVFYSQCICYRHRSSFFRNFSITVARNARDVSLCTTCKMRCTISKSRKRNLYTSDKPDRNHICPNSYPNPRPNRKQIAQYILHIAQTHKLRSGSWHNEVRLRPTEKAIDLSLIHI